ncbi:MAG TPA: aminotransferase class I/II-fold pyridoxal phosphate-dependent enzyme [Acidimicrobiales bacterium]|nr:aminotransferase class I/II-fold pyridoxal phosphate-dependent enzyme [Acidimicrobiales bacterium]
MSAPAPFTPPTYPYDRLKPIAEIASAHPGGIVDLSIGTPCDPPPAAVIEALASSGAERGYPAGVGSTRLLDSARGWIERRFGVTVERGGVAACIGTKELVAGIPHWLRLRAPGRDTVLYPELSYPTYAMGAVLAGARAVAVPARPDGSSDFGAVAEEDAARALCCWVNSPSNPTGALEDLAAAVAWGRAHGVPVLSDECYTEFTWEGPPRTILSSGIEGVLAVHSISKRSNCAGLRFGFYAGDADLVHYLSELRRHAGFMVPGPVQAAAAVALDDDDHVALQRRRYRGRLERFVAILGSIGVPAAVPSGGFYLWVAVPGDLGESWPGSLTGGGGGRLRGPSEGPEWAFTRLLAEAGGVLVSPGEFYGPAGSGHVRIAMVAPDDRLELAADRLGASGLVLGGLAGPVPAGAAREQGAAPPAR